MTTVKYISEVRHWQNNLDNWMMIPLDTKFNNGDRAFIVKYNVQQHYEVFRSRPFIHQKYFWVIAHKGSRNIPLCVFIAKISDSEDKNFSVHEQIFDLTNPQSRSCLQEFVGSENYLFVLASNDDASLITLKKDPYLETQVQVIINSLINNDGIDTTLLNEAKSLIYSIGNTKELMDVLDQYAIENGSTILHINIE